MRKPLTNTKRDPEGAKLSKEWADEHLPNDELVVVHLDECTMIRFRGVWTTHEKVEQN